MKKKVLILDTSILCVWLQVFGQDKRCGCDDDYWDFNRVNSKIKEEVKRGSTFVLPLATIIETGNHIAQSSGNKYSLARELCKVIVRTAEEATPWAAFSEQENLWKSEGLKKLAERWQHTAATGQSLGDASIVDVAKYYYAMGFEVEILTGDAGLKAYQPESSRQSSLVPRRRVK